MTDHEYHAHPAIGREQLLLLADSPELFHAVESGAVSKSEARQLLESTGPTRSKTDAFAIGEGVHRMIFEPGTVADRFQVIDPAALTSNGQRRGKKWEAYEAQWTDQGKVLVTATQMQLMSAVAKALDRTIGGLLAPDAILEDPLFWDEIVPASDLLIELADGSIEGQLLQTVDPQSISDVTVGCRGKPDYLLVRPNLAICLDLKTCRDPREFHHDVKQWRLWMQAAHYMAGVKAKYGLVPQWYWVAVSKSYPYRVRVTAMDEETTAAAVERRHRLLIEYAARTISGDWDDPIDATIDCLHVQVE